MICSICLLACRQEEERCSQCKSVFHFACMSQWIRFGKGCPNCRFCASLALLRQIIPDIPSETTDALTTMERDVLCRMAAFLLLMKAVDTTSSDATSLSPSTSVGSTVSSTVSWLGTTDSDASEHSGEEQ